MSESFKISPFIVDTALQPVWPSVKDCIGILMSRYFSQNTICLKLQCVKVREANPSEMFFESVEDPEVTRGQVRTVGRGDPGF